MTGIIDAVAYGFYADGEHFNDAVMAKYIENDCKTPIFFPEGTYLFSETIAFPDLCFVELAAHAEFKLVSSEVKEYFITLRKGRTGGGYAFNCYLKGGFINANNMAKNGIGVYKTRHVVFEDFFLKNVLEKGIVTRTEDNPDGQSFFRNVLIENDFALPGTVGVFDNAFDTHFDQVEVVNFETAYNTVCGRFNHCSAWLRDNSVIENSTFARIRGYDIVFSSPAVDTYRYGFKIVDQRYNVSISDMLWITNGGVYTPELREKFPRVIFNADYDTGSYFVSGLKINNEDNLEFSNRELFRSKFLNVRTVGDFDPFEKIKHFRNDNDEGFGKIGGNLDSLKPGLYECTELFGEEGVLEVKKAGNITLQRFMGEKTFAYRINKGVGFGEWNKVK